jgi:hypothetical protein
MKMRVVSPLCVALLIAAGLSSEGLAQESARRRPTRVPVTVVLVDTLSAERGFLILRRADTDPRDVILLGGAADTVALTEAVDELLLMRRAQGDTSRVTGTMRVRRTYSSAGGSPSILPWARRIVDDLRRAARRDVAGVGDVPAVVIWLPPQRRSRATQE